MSKNAMDRKLKLLIIYSFISHAYLYFEMYWWSHFDWPLFWNNSWKNKVFFLIFFYKLANINFNMWRKGHPLVFILWSEYKLIRIKFNSIEEKIVFIRKSKIKRPRNSMLISFEELKSRSGQWLGHDVGQLIFGA